MNATSIFNFTSCLARFFNLIPYNAYFTNIVILIIVLVNIRIDFSFLNDEITISKMIN